MNTERGALLLSMVAALVVGVAALAIGFVTGSGAILLDGAFNLCFFATAVFTLRVARLLKNPDDARYPFGYVQFEPLINLTKGLLILGVGCFALIDAALSISRGGSDVSAGIAVSYAAVALALCGAVLLTLRKAAPKLASPLVEGDVENWGVNTAISIGMLVAFLLAIGLSFFGWESAARLVDPGLVILVVLVTIGVPLRMVYRGMAALLLRGVDDELVQEAASRVRQAVAVVAPKDVLVRILQPGRTTYILAHVVVDHTKSSLSIAEADALRSAILVKLSEKFAPVVADVVFTSVLAFSAPTTGWAPGDAEAISASPQNRQ
ncbi:hypothetical protein ASE63_25255 [Bosea sp. Root381]|uniref:cation diffusion facilitator family transporter n=1 Tax=Bosea sp. Root381 TaxID=1736524 RepID=UPI000715FCE6|nr:cation diffusion facilitator family transporter [Bosea sp. Root381]KRE04922.1 hypothetical protein ASE63_25255 [Bosea sp. Root381]